MGTSAVTVYTDETAENVEEGFYRVAIYTNACSYGA